MQKIKFKFARIDIVIIIFCFAGACFSGAAFWLEYNNTFIKMNEEPVGTIVFKKRTAQRRFVERNVWDRLKNSSPVYNGDTIRTIEQSEAVVIFQDQVTYITLDESTMVQIFFDNQNGAKIDLSGGNLEVVSDNKNVVISSGDSTIVLEGQARINKDEDEIVLSVLEGQASFDETTIEAGNVLAIDSKGGISTKPVVVMTSFGSSVYILSAPEETASVVFSWKSFYFDSDTYIIIEIALDKGFNNIIEAKDISGGTSVSIPVKNGNYWWRVYPANSGSREPASKLFPSGTLEVIPSAAPVLAAPLHAADLAFSGETLVPLSWSVVDRAFEYLVEISAYNDMKNPVVSRRVEKNSVTQSSLNYGRWYWRVTPLFPPQIKGAGIPSAIGEFSILMKRPVIAAPVLSFPSQNGKVYTDSSGSRMLWSYDPNVSFWFVELSEDIGMANPAVKQNVYNNYLTIAPELLQEGKTWYWRVTALGGESPAVSKVHNFEVTGESQPVAKPVLVSIPSPPPIIFTPDLDNWDIQSNETIAINEKTLSRIVSILNTYSEYKVRVEGHANPLTHPSDIEARLYEQTETLQPLSEMRAKVVVDCLIKLGIDPNRLSYYGLGGEYPVASWDDYTNWWKNRRVEFILVK